MRATEGETGASSSLLLLSGSVCLFLTSSTPLSVRCLLGRPSILQTTEKNFVHYEFFVMFIHLRLFSLIKTCAS